jgi:manganese/iron transport system permease protein
MLAVAAALGLGAAVLGVYASFWLDSAPAPTVVLVLTLAFALSLVRERLVARRLRGRAAAGASTGGHSITR